MFKKLYAYLERIATALDALVLLLTDLVGIVVDYVAPDAGNGENAPKAWWEYPQEEWPSNIDGMRVGYVMVGVDKSPLYTLKDETNIPVIYESDEIREGDNTDAKRIIAKAGKWLMVYALGDTWGYGDPRPFGQEIDGDDLYYLVMQEQVVDGIHLLELPEYFPLYVKYADITKTYMPE